nr:MAG TPA: Glycine rich protein [Caudoviricetes sp.]
MSNVYNFEYTGAVQQLTLPKGKYILECWGAQGGYRSVFENGGKGGYSVGTLSLESQTTVYVYAGGSGNSGGTNGGFNGGGKRSTYNGGGGASDIRI